MAVRKHPPRSEQGRLLLTLHPEIGCQGWTRTNTERLNRPPCYFDTTWQWLTGAAGRSRTCISPLRRRMPHMFDHGSNRTGLMDWWIDGKTLHTTTIR